MTPEQFSALAALMGQPASKSAAAARLVLVDGLSSAEAARRVGITTQGANQAVQRCRRVIELARVVCGEVSEFPTCSRPHWIAPASLPFLEAVAIYGLGVMTDGGPKQLRALAKSYERAPSLRLIALLSPSSTGASETASPV